MHRGCDRSRSDSCETHVDYRAREGFKRPVVDVSGVGGGFTDQTAISGKANTIAFSPRLISWRQVGARPPSRRCQIQGQGSRASSRWRAQDRGAAPRVSSHDAILLAHTRKPAPAPDARRPTPDARRARPAKRRCFRPRLRWGVKSLAICPPAVWEPSWANAACPTLRAWIPDPKPSVVRSNKRLGADGLSSCPHDEHPSQDEQPWSVAEMARRQTVVKL